ncbi:MAG: 23S rRNA (guanosine(2251)-2'-O)-methyltransferase RlmB [Verrucomicrobiota bacterium]
MAKRTYSRDARHNAHAADRVQLEPMNEKQFLAALKEIDEPFVLVIDGVQDPHNLGACLRSADAAGVDFVVAPQKHTVGLTETVRRIACGGADHVPYIQVQNLNRTLEKLKEAGLWLVGTGDEEAQLLYEVDMKGPLAIVLGREDTGVRKSIADKCDFLVKIPMNGTVECLNLSVATGVCLFEAVRQRS